MIKKYIKPEEIHTITNEMVKRYNKDWDDYTAFDGKHDKKTGDFTK